MKSFNFFYYLYSWMHGCQKLVRKFYFPIFHPRNIRYRILHTGPSCAINPKHRPSSLFEPFTERIKRKNSAWLNGWPTGSSSLYTTPSTYTYVCIVDICTNIYEQKKILLLLNVDGTCLVFHRWNVTRYREIGTAGILPAQ